MEFGWLNRLSKNSPALFEIPEYEVFDIDYEWQFNTAEALFMNEN